MTKRGRSLQRRSFTDPLHALPSVPDRHISLAALTVQLEAKDRELALLNECLADTALQLELALAQEAFARAHWHASNDTTEALREELRGLHARVLEIEGSLFWTLGQHWLALRHHHFDRIPCVSALLTNMRSHLPPTRTRSASLETPARVALPSPRATAGESNELLLPPAPGPLDVSVILPCLKGDSDILPAIQSLIAFTRPGRYELLIGYGPASRDRHLPAVRRATFHAAEADTYPAICNAMARMARGQHLVFLRNYALVQDGWLDFLLQLLDGARSVGMVLPKLQTAQGRIVHSGPQIANHDASFSLPLGADASLPEYNYVRPAYRCSAACAVIPRSLFDQLSGFEESLAEPDESVADFALRIQTVGQAVQYQPMSVVLVPGEIDHPESSTFRMKWQGASENRRSWSSHRMLPQTVLFIDRHVPTWDRDSGSRRMFEYIAMLRDSGTNVAFWPDDLQPREPYTRTLQSMGVEVMYGEQSLPVYLHSRNIAAAYCSRSEVTRRHIDVLTTAAELGIIYDPHDLSYVREQREAIIARDRGLTQRAAASERREDYIMRRSDVIVSVSTADMARVKRKFPNKRHVLLQSIFDPQRTDLPFARRSGLVFVGGFKHSPNVDAMLWFVSRVLPQIVQSVPDVTLDIVGSDPPDSVLRLSGDHIRVTGYVPDIDPYLGQARVFVAPLRYGAGEKGKIAYSLSRGLPVVTTSIGAEGMSLTPGRDVAVADTAEEFAQAVVVLYTDATLWGQLAEMGLEYVALNHSRQLMMDRLGGVLQGFGVPVVRPGPASQDRPIPTP